MRIEAMSSNKLITDLRDGIRTRRFTEGFFITFAYIFMPYFWLPAP